MAQYQCFLAERLQKYEQTLRRYNGNKQDCPGPYKYHDAQVFVGYSESPKEDDDLEGNCTDFVSGKDDPRWPKKCDHCAYIFADEDNWQQNSHRMYRNPTNGQEFTLWHAPVGAMWFADWMSFWKGPDGKCLVLQTPGGDWPIDGPSSNGPGWQRTGTPPKVTANPSIHFPGRYHGWLRDGVLVDC